MDFEAYRAAITPHFIPPTEVTLAGRTASIFYEERFELKWLATKLKSFTYLAYADSVGREDIAAFSKAAMQDALQRYRGLPRGFQNGVVAYAALASENVSPEAAAWAASRPKKHFAAMELPVIVDLSKGLLHYYRGTPIWGAIYYPHFRSAIEKNFTPG